MTPVIIEAAINGATPKARNPNVPVAPAEIAADALHCTAAGASIVHSHIDDLSLSGSIAAARYLEGWRPLLREHRDAIVYPTVSIGGTIQDRFLRSLPIPNLRHLRNLPRRGSPNGEPRICPS